MSGWTVEDPELVATFRAEVDERLASLQAGLLALEGNRSPRQAIAGLFRDAHTVKGSARMLGLHGVLELAHTCEDLLGALRDGRFAPRKDLVDLLLAACDAIGRAVPGADPQLDDATLAPLIDVLKQALGGAEGLVAPTLAHVQPTHPLDEPAEHRTGADSVRVSAEKVYALLDVVGEAELGARRIEQTVVTLLAELGNPTGHDQLRTGLRALRELVEAERGLVARVRDDAMGLAMVPVRRTFSGLTRIVRDVAGSTGKDAALTVAGEDVELDKQVLDGIADALKHLVINAVDHGVEAPDVRRRAGKPQRATVHVAARSAGGAVVIEVSDDGAGIDEDAVRRKAVAAGLLPADSTLTGPQLWQLLFLPTFSTNASVTETSGRGVGLDVVQSAAEELGGSVQVRTTPGRGTTFTLTLPITLGVLRCLLARVGPELYAVPVPSVVESLSLRDAAVHEVAGASVVVRHGQSLPLLDLGAALGVVGDRAPRSALVARHGERTLAWAVDRLEGELELVVKDLGPFLGRLPLVTGATIHGDGSVVCLLDLRELADQATGGLGPSAVVPAQRLAPEPVPTRPLRVLVVEDSVGVRELERVILESAGYLVDTAVDGLDGAARLGAPPADLVLTDVEMPGMDGFTLTRTIRRTAGWEHVPVVIMTSRGAEEHQRTGADAGASAYLLKQEFDQHSLLETVRRLVGRPAGAGPTGQ